ncbi:MAG: sulfatase-like hydrolase/transferase [Firmicutes bacterium]|nr:sulfatase-like hydrolase/transferase [Bacillota bacterium]
MTHKKSGIRERTLIFKPAPDKHTGKMKRALYYLWQYGMLLLASVCLGALLLIFAHGDYSWHGFLGYFKSPAILFFNILPVSAIIFIFYGITGRAWAAFLFGGILSSVLPLANYYLLAFRDDTIRFEDLTLIREAMAMVSEQHYDLFVDLRILALIFSLAAGTLILSLFVRYKIRRAPCRAAIALITAALFVISLFGYFSDDTYDSVQNYDYFNRWSETQEYISRGFYYPFIHSISDFFDETAPDGYDEETAKAILSEYEDADIDEDKKVNVIAIMREAYADFSQFDIEGFDTSAYDTYHKIQSESKTGNLIVNVFGGGTVDTERSFLTGVSSLRDYRSSVDSYVRYFASQGYLTTGIHPYYKWFYNRQNINTYLGFESYRFYEDDFEYLTADALPKDSLLYDELYSDYCELTADGTPYFSFSVTVQSHGPYSTTSYSGDTEYLTGDYSDECKNAFNNYINEITDGDEALYALMETLRDDETPVVLIVFADHMPWMGDGNAYYNELGIDVSTSTDEGFYTHYTTEYLIWGNEAAKETLSVDFTGTGPTVSPCFLMNVLFDTLGWDGPAYMQATDEVMASIPVITTTGRYIVSGELVTEIPESYVELYARFSYIEYYRNHVFTYE